MTTTTVTVAPNWLSGFKRLLHARESGVFAALLLLFVVGSLISPSLIQGDNLLSVGQQISQIGIMAVGATFVIINGEIDLSVGSIYALGAIVTGMTIAAGIAWPIAIVLGLLAGTIAGAINGAATVFLGIPSFIVTLGTLSVFRGITLIISNGAPISLSNSIPGVAEFSLIGQGRLLGVIPMQLLWAPCCFRAHVWALIRMRLAGTPKPRASSASTSNA
jgi:ribose transport system permease protein